MHHHGSDRGNRQGGGVSSLRPVDHEFYQLPITSFRDFLSVLDNLTVVLHGLFVARFDKFIVLL